MPLGGALEESEWLDLECWIENLNSCNIKSSDERYEAAKAVLDNQCINCHTHSSWASLDKSGWESNIRIAQGDPVNSKFFKKLWNYGGNMPQNGSSLSSNDLEALECWIREL